MLEEIFSRCGICDNQGQNHVVEFFKTFELENKYDVLKGKDREFEYDLQDLKMNIEKAQKELENEESIAIGDDKILYVD